LLDDEIDGAGRLRHEGREENDCRGQTKNSLS
jgi:hypothetical protein